MSDTPETIAAVEASDGQWSFVLKQTCAKLERERDQWKADCLEQARLLAMSADREEKLRTQTGYWESLIRWLEQTQEAHKGQDRDWDLTQVYMRGPFAGWSQSDMVKLADKLWENEQKHPLRGDRK